MSASAATQTQTSAWVSANAGSGKTYVLISRLVSLMLDGTSPERLLCLTYTRGAAAEMQNRLYDLLREWALMTDEALQQAVFERIGVRLHDKQALYRARTLFAHALETPGGLKIQTIHAFCEGLLHRFPLEADLTPGFELIDEASARAMLQRIIRRLMLSGKDFEEMQYLSRLLVERDFTSLISKLVNARDRYQIYDGAELDEYLTAIYGRDQQAGWATARDEFLTRFTPISKSFVLAAHNHGSATDRRHAEILQEAFNQEDGAQKWHDLRLFFETSAGLERKQLYTKALAKAAPAETAAVEACAGRFHQIENARRVDAARRTTAALYRVAAQIQALYSEEKAKLNVLDYDDLISQTRRLLADKASSAWVLYKLDNGLDHILIDEAQDTSPAQWEVIRALAGDFFSGDGARAIKRTIFAVGDEKQSIFSFQGADPASFDEMRQFFDDLVRAADADFQSLDLIKSYRSAPAILQVVDQTFATPARATGLTAGGQVIRHEADRTGNGYVALWRPEESPRASGEDIWWQTQTESREISAREKTAERIAEKIKSLLASSASKIGAKDILILVRRRNAIFYEILRSLNKYRIPVAGADRMQLLNEIVVKDLLSLADLALNPFNDLALAIFLRSPFGRLCRADDIDLFNLAYERPASLFEALLRHGENPIYKQAADDVEWIRQNTHLPPFDFFARYLSARQGQARLKGRLGPEIDDAINEFLRLALQFERQNPASLQGFVRWIKEHATEIKREMDQGQDAVRIMTIHGAKGLEAHTVFLIDDGEAPGLSAREKVIISGDGLIWRPAVKERPRDPDARLQRAEVLAVNEARRLLYVALTRARDRLYIAPYVQAGRKPAETSWFSLLADCFPDCGQAELVWEIGEETDATDSADPQHAASSLVYEAAPAWLSASVPHKSGRAHVSVTRLAAGGHVHNPMAGQAARNYGILVHTILQFLPAVPEDQRAAQLDMFLRSHASYLEPDRASALTEAVSHLLSQDALKPLFSPDAQVEVPLQGMLRHQDGTLFPVSGQIDRLFVDRNSDFVWLVDFKTGAQRGAAQDAYIKQMAIYRSLVEQALGMTHIRCSLIWVEEGVEQRLSQEEIDAALADILSAPLDNNADAF